VTQESDRKPDAALLAQSVTEQGASLSRRDFIAALSAVGASATAGLARGATPPIAQPREQCFDNGWRFHRGTLDGAEASGFDDSRWREIDLPHDWGIEDLPYATSEDGAASADPASWATPSAPDVIGPFDRQTGDRPQGYLIGGEGWYRKHFTLEHQPADAQVELRLDGVFQNADVWLNGEHLAFHPCGYTPVLLSLMNSLRAGSNVLAVRVRNLGSTSRWYPGSGIYRHTWLVATRAVRVPAFGVRITSSDIDAENATVRVEIEAENKGATDAQLAVSVMIFDADGRKAAQSSTVKAQLAGGARSTYVLSLKLARPRLWSPATPHLYSAHIELQAGAEVLDKLTQPFGVRSISFDARGFLLNGEPLKMRGGCVHSQHGALGAASFDAAEERRVRILKAHGFNAVRTAHNPPSPGFLDACDRLGMLVYAEAFDMWDQAKRQDDYHLYFAAWYQRDLELFIKRDRNHPSIVIWSTGNEIMDAIGRAPQVAQRMRLLDPSRPVTQSSAMGMADLNATSLSGAEWQYLDVGDVHYQLAYEAMHQAQPHKALVQSESWVANTFDNWKAVENNDSAFGDFVWTAWDYLGETGVGAARLVAIGAAPLTLQDPFPKVDYPWFQSDCGDIDLIGQPKPQNFYRRVVYGDRALEMLIERPAPAGMEQRAHMWSWFDELKSWSWNVDSGRLMRVRVYTRGDEVQLELNGTLVGSKRLTDADKRIASFDVPYYPGALTAIARSAGQEIARETIATVGAASALRLSSEPETLFADRGSVAHVLLEVIDANGQIAPDAVVPVHFEVSGSAQIIGVGSANPRNVDSFRRPEHETYHGQAQVVLRSTAKAGSVRLRAQANGLQPAELRIQVAQTPRSFSWRSKTV
jgi:beta-galactosidase